MAIFLLTLRQLFSAVHVCNNWQRNRFNFEVSVQMVVTFLSVLLWLLLIARQMGRESCVSLLFSPFCPSVFEPDLKYVSIYKLLVLFEELSN
jgi:hypothetical protein